MGKLFVTVLLVVVFEGAARKWISPALTTPLVLLRDGLALAGVLYALRTGAFRRHPLIAQGLMLWCGSVVIWGLSQSLFIGVSPVVSAIGVRFWLLYLMFGVAAALALTSHDLIAIQRTIFWLVILMAPLVVTQHFLPPGATLNKQIDGDETGVFVVVANIVRTTGTFSFTAGFTTFLAFAAPFVLSLLSAPKAKKLRGNWVMPLLALTICTVVSGARSAWLFLGALFIVFAVAALRQGRSSKWRAVLGIAALIGIVVALLIVFDRAFVATQERFAEASQIEQLGTRIYITFLGRPETYEHATLFGSGIGLGSNLGTSYIGASGFFLAEEEPGRIILEAGLLGALYLALKLLVAFIGLRRAYSLLRQKGDMLPFLLWVTTAMALMTWSIMGQLTINSLGFMLLGAAGASLRLGTAGPRFP